MLKVVGRFLIVLLNILFYGAVLFGGVQIFRASYSFAYDILGDNAAQPPPGEDRLILVTASQDEFDVAENLEMMGLVGNKYSFYLRMMLKKSDASSLNPGSHRLNTSMSYEEILHVVMTC